MLVHTDQYISSVGRRLPHTYGREGSSDKYKGGIINYHSASTIIYACHQVSFVACNTIAGKHLLDQFSASVGVNVQGYHADNHIFNSKEYIQDCELRGQKIKFCGVEAHYQNGCAERAIKAIMSWARTILIEAAIHWPDVIDLDLWPYVVDHAV